MSWMWCSSRCISALVGLRYSNMPAPCWLCLSLKVRERERERERESFERKGEGRERGREGGEREIDCDYFLLQLVLRLRVE